MSLHIHHLTGCAPAPLAHYLKALGILRLVAEQKDPSARLWWQDEHAVLATTLDKENLQRFFLKEYAPSPVLGPWAARSGFFSGSSERSAREALLSLEQCSDSRFSVIVNCIDACRKVLNRHGISEKAADETKTDLLFWCRNELPRDMTPWFDACFVLESYLEKTEKRRSFPAIFGSGGNEGSGSYVSNFAQAIDRALVKHSCVHALESALFGGGKKCPSLSLGHFLPEDASDPWDILLCIEGAIVFASSVSRRLEGDALPAASAPFAVTNQSAGYSSAAPDEKLERGEQWMPTWSAPSSAMEVMSMIAEGHVQIGCKQARRPGDIVRAIARLGATRGINAFVRFGYLERKGQNNLAIPLARWEVRAQPNRSLADHAAEWIDRFTMKVRSDEHAPTSWKAAARRCDEALLATCRNGRDRKAWEELLLAMGAAEQLLAQTPKKADKAGLRPLRDFPAGWLTALPPSPELRLAAALAGQVGTNDDERHSPDFRQPVRIHFLPFVQNTQHHTWDCRSFADHPSPEVIATSGSFLRDAGAVVRRRLHSGRFALRAGSGHYASLADLAAFLRGDLDEVRILALARPLMALDWKRALRLPFPEISPADTGVLALYGVLRLAHMPHPFSIGGTDFSVRTDPAIVQRLLGGDAASALTLAARRLTAVGLRPYLRTAVADRVFAQRLAASLVFPIHPDAATWLAERLCHSPMAPVTTTQVASIAATPVGVHA